MAYTKKSYVDHVAIRVADIDWYVRLLREVLGMTPRQESAPGVEPRQIWIHGGLQLISDPEFRGVDGRPAHVGFMVEDRSEAIRAARDWGLSEAPQGENWFVLPDGFVIEILQASGSSVADALAIDPRA